MKSIDSKIVELLNEGFQYTTLKRLSNPQINLLHQRIVTEQNKIDDKVKGVQTLTTGIKQANMAAKELDKTIEELGEDDVDQLSPYSGKQTQSPKQVGPSTNDGDDDYQDGMDIDEQSDDESEFRRLVSRGKKKWDRFADKRAERTAKKEIKKHFHKYGDMDSVDDEKGLKYAIGVDDPDFMLDENKKRPSTPVTTLGMMEEENNPWAICTSSLKLEGKKKDTYTKDEKRKLESCIREVKLQNESYRKKVRFVENRLLSLLNKDVKEVLTKKQILDMVAENTKEAPVKTPVKTPSKPERHNPYAPKHKSAPKAGGTKEAPVKTPVKTPSKPERLNPYAPKHKPAPKAKNEGNLPEFLKFDNLNITFRDE